MPQIYAIRDDGIKFQELDFEIPDLFDRISDTVSLDDILEFNTRNTAMKSWWVTPACDFSPRPAYPSGAIPDISLWIDASLVLSPRAYRLLGELLEPLGEFLPVLVGEETFHIFNCFEIGDVKEETVEHEYHGDMKLGIKHFEFDDSVLDKIVFKTPVQRCLTLYCTDHFKELVESFELSGLSFDTELLVPSPFED